MSFVIAGLGNPGTKYENTRHNVGFMLIDHLAGKYGVTLAPVKWDALMARSMLWGSRICLVKPETYMNRSGKSVAGVANYYDVDAGSVLVVHDDLDMDVGRVKLVKGGGAGGHNGIRSIVQHLGTPDFYRLKIGIGRPGNSDAHPDMPVDKFVLSPFSNDEMNLVQERIALLEEGLEFLVHGDDGQAMSLLNRLK